MVYILLVVLWFKGGLVQTSTLQAHSAEDCNNAIPSIVREYRQASYPSLSLDQSKKDLVLIDVKAQCVLVDASI